MRTPTEQAAFEDAVAEIQEMSLDNLAELADEEGNVAYPGVVGQGARMLTYTRELVVKHLVEEGQFPNPDEFDLLIEWSATVRLKDALQAFFELELYDTDAAEQAADAAHDSLVGVVDEVSLQLACNIIRHYAPGTGN